MIKLRLTHKGRHIIEVVKLVRMFTELGLKESKELVDNVPSILISNREDISTEQIIKNFAAIGAKVEIVIEEEKPQNDIIGSDDINMHNKPGAAKKMQSKTTWQASAQKKNKSDWSMETQKPLPYLQSKDKTIIKPAIIVAIALALIKSILAFIFSYYTIYTIFLVAICIAYFLRKYNPASSNLGIMAILITFIYYFSTIVLDWILYMIFYQHFAPFNILGIFASLFRGYNLLTFIAAGLAFFMSSNKNIFKKLNNTFDHSNIDIE